MNEGTPTQVAIQLDKISPVDTRNFPTLLQKQTPIIRHLECGSNFALGASQVVSSPNQSSSYHPFEESGRDALLELSGKCDLVIL